MAVDVGSAVGYLDLDINGFLSGLRSAQSEADSASKGIEKKFESIGATMEKVGKTSTAFITTPIVTAITGVVKNFGDLEQSIGGVETMFKDSAGIVIKNAESAYKTAGVSANSYMEQVTSISARLLQGLGGDTVTAAKIADTAIIDMSDNANKFGTNLGSIQDAYQGFAKANFTMLDNLKLGYGGTATEMARLINDSGVLNGEFEATAENVKDIPLHTMFEAIHEIQDGLGVTGTTAKEAAETISGSFGMAKASITDFLAQLGNPGADMDMFAQNMFDSFKAVIDNVKRVLATLWENLPIEDWQKKLLVAAAAFGPVMFAAGKVVSTIGTIIPVVGKATKAITAFGEGFTLAKAGFPALGAEASKFGVALAGISAPMIAIAAVVAVLVAAFATLWKTNEGFRDNMTKIWQQIKDTVGGFLQGITDRINALGFDFKNITEVIWSIWKGFCDLLAPVFEGVFQQIANIIDVVFDVILGVLDIFIGIFTGNWEQVWNGVKGIFSGVWDFIKATFSNWANTFKKLADTILGWFGTTWENTWNSIKQFFVDIWNGITSFFTNTINGIKTAVSNFIQAITNFFAQLPTNIANFITQAWNSVVQWSTNMVNKAREMGQNFLNSVVEFFTNLPYKVGYFIGNTLTNIIIWVANMVEKAREMGTNFLNMVVSFFTQLPGKVLQFITSAYQNVQQWATNMWNKAKEMGTNFLNAVVSFFTQLPGKVLQFITSALDNVKTWATNMVAQAREMGTNFINNVVSFLTQLPGKVKGFLDSAIENVKTWVTQMGQKGKEAIESLISNVIEAAKSIPSKMAEIGKNMVEGVWDGIKNAASWFTNQVKGFFSGIVDGVKDGLGINSPSKVMADQVGKWMPAGVATGFEKAMPAAMRNIQTALNKGIDSVEADDISISAKTNVESFSNKLKNIYESVATWFETIEYRIGGSIDRMTESLASLIQMGGMVVNSDGTLGYVGYNGFGSKPQPNQMPTNPTRGDNDSGGDTYNFYSPKPIDEIEAARQLKKTKRDLSEGF